MATTGKNSKDRVIRITNILGDMFSINMSLQSMDEQVLKNIERANIKLDHMIDVNKYLTDQGRSTKADLIIGLPGESKETFIAGLNNVLNSNSAKVTIYTLMLLHGTEFKNPSYRDKFGYQGKYRIVPLNFGEYDSKRIFDYEEVGVVTKDMSFDDYLYLRVIALFVESLHNGKPFNEFFLYAKHHKIEPATFLKMLNDNRKKASAGIQNLVNNFINETKNELWESEKELIEHYKKDENFLKLKKGEIGGNLIYKYKSKNLVENSSDWLVFFENELYKAVIKKSNNTINPKQIKSEIDEISKFCKLKLHGLLNPKIKTEPIEENFKYDILKWIDHYDEKNSLSNYKFKKLEKLVFEYTNDQLKMRNDVFKRYGTDINALSKIVTRISNLESQFRKVRYERDKYLRDVYKRRGENFERYALSN